MKDMRTEQTINELTSALQNQLSCTTFEEHAFSVIRSCISIVILDYEKALDVREQFIKDIIPFIDPKKTDEVTELVEKILVNLSKD